MADKVDLSLTGQVDPSNKDYYLVKVTGLKLYNLYTAKFQWSFQEQALSDRVKLLWSNGFTINTLNLTTLTKPKLLSTNIRRSQGNIIVTWDGVDNTGATYGGGFKRINVYVKNNSDASPFFQLLGFIDKVGGAFAFPANPTSYTVRLTAVDALGTESTSSDEFIVSAITDPPSAPSGLSASWSGTDFNISFTHDTTSSSNSNLKEYIVKLIPQSPTPFKEFSLTPTSGSSQKFSLSLEVNQAAFGDAQTQFSGTITAVDIYNNKSTPISFNNTVYATQLTTPTITASAISNGYTVLYPVQTSNTFNLISIEEVESSASTAPTTGYSVVKTDKANPSIVSTTNNNKRWVRVRLNDNLNSFTSYSNSVAVTPISPVVTDTDGPPNVTSVTTSAAIDTSGYLGFNGYIDVSWSPVTTDGIRGYRIRFSNNAGTTYSYVDSPGSGTTYRLSGLSVGSTYQIAVATYDEYNNTSTSYVSASDVTITGTPSISNYITAGPFEFGTGVGGVSTNKGLYFDTSNYWFINASNSARLKVGGSTSNYLLWDGSEFVIDGNISARTGTFRGNVSIISGGSLYSGTLVSGNLSGAGYILNSSGLTFNSSSVSGITTIDASTGKLTTASAYIGSWDVNSSTLFKTTAAGTLSLNSSDATITATGTGYTSGVGVPDANNIVIWAGANKTTAPFRVYKDGSVIANSITLSGYATTSDISNFITGAQVNSNVTSISGGAVTTGVIKSSNFPGNGQTANGAGFSSSGTAIDLTYGTITSKQFRIDTSGNAVFAGALSSGVSISAPQIIGLTSMSVGSSGSGYYFTVNSQGLLTAEGATIKGTIQSGAFTLSGYESTNKWTSGVFKAGGETTYVQALASGSALLYASDTSSTERDDGSVEDLNNNLPSTYLTLAIPSQVEVTPTGVKIYGIPGVNNGLTATGTLINYFGTGASDTDTTRYRSAGYYTSGNLPTQNYGKAARFRMIIADPYDNNMLKRGLGVYYGTRSSAPSASTGFVGDLWISW